MNDQEFLAHYGVLGMRWGSRSHRDKQARIQTAKKANLEVRKAKRTKGKGDPGDPSEDHTKASNLKKKPLSQMSNAEIRALNERLQLERQYRDLNRKETSKGEKFVKDILVNAAKQTATNYTSKYMSKGIDVVIKKAVGGE